MKQLIRTKMGMKKVILMEDCRMEPRGGKGGMAVQSVGGRMGLGAACKGETSRMKTVSKLCIHRNIYIYIHTYYVVAR
jgi:hypothetical protein